MLKELKYVQPVLGILFRTRTSQCSPLSEGTPDFPGGIHSMNFLRTLILFPWLKPCSRDYFISSITQRHRNLQRLICSLSYRDIEKREQNSISRFRPSLVNCSSRLLGGRGACSAAAGWLRAGATATACACTLRSPARTGARPLLLVPPGRWALALSPQART